MNITKIELINFRNYNKKKLDKFSNLNIIIGKNGIGKTSIIESIYIGSLAKSFKTNNELSIIKKGENFFKVKIFCYDYGIKKKLELIYDKSGSKTKINSFLQKKLSNFISQYTVILLSPDELKLIKSAPSIRRNYFNIELSQLNKQYLNILNSYNHLIKNKNEYLRRINYNKTIDNDYLDILDEKISEEGLKIYNFRLDYINKINKYINQIFITFCKKGNLYLKYVSDFDVEKKEEILNMIIKNRPKEIKIAMSNFGIHRDDIVFMYNNYDAKEYCSQGIQKLIILAMKLAEIKIFLKDYNIRPILLLDDLFSELDEKNRNNIFKSLNNDIQIFITTTDLKNINRNILNKAKIYNLDEMEG